MGEILHTQTQKNNLQLNDTYTDINNFIFDLIDNHHKKENRYQPSTPHPTTPPQTYSSPPQHIYKYQHTQKASDTGISNIDNIPAKK
jgi:hypothetical protein